MAHIDQPHLVERYNHALEAFGLPKTKRSTFRVDATGFSPEIAEEFKDEQYLDPLGVNRRFIIVTPEQALQPVEFFAKTGWFAPEQPTEMLPLPPFIQAAGRAHSAVRSTRGLDLELGQQGGRQ